MANRKRNKRQLEREARLVVRLAALQNRREERLLMHRDIPESTWEARASRSKA